jgi:YggT family protein
VSIVHWLLQLYVILIFGRVILSWFPIGPGSALGPVHNLLYRVTEPVLGPVRRALPPLRMGAVGLDLSPILVLVGLQVLERLLPY